MRPKRVAAHNRSFGDNSADLIVRALKNTHTSKLRVFRFGTFRDSTVNFETLFKQAFGTGPNLAVASITVNRKAGSEYSFSHNLVGLC